MEKFKITATHPTPIIQDFSTYLNYLVQHQPIALTTKAGHLPPKVLAELNPLLQCKNKGGNNPRSKQTAYYLLNLFFHIGIDGGFFYLKPHGKTKIILEPNIVTIKKFNDFNETEQYMYLLKTLLVDITNAKLNLTTPWKCTTPSTIANVIAMLFDNQYAELIPDAADLAEQIFKQQIPWMGDYALYLSWFGFWEIVIRDIKPFIEIVEEAQPTSLGLAMVAVLHKHRSLRIWSVANRTGWLEKKAMEAMLNNEPFDEAVAIAALDKTITEPFFWAFISLFPDGALRKDSF